jgi:hypothetical protein
MMSFNYAEYLGQATNLAPLHRCSKNALTPIPMQRAGSFVSKAVNGC